MSRINGDKARNNLQARRRNVQRAMDRAARAKSVQKAAPRPPARPRREPAR